MEGLNILDRLTKRSLCTKIIKSKEQKEGKGLFPLLGTGSERLSFTVFRLSGPGENRVKSPPSLKRAEKDVKRREFIWGGLSDFLAGKAPRDP